MIEQLTVHLVCRDAARAAQWYGDALGAEEQGRVPVPDGRFMQIELRFGDSTVMIADEFPEFGVVSPLAVGGVSSTLSLHAADVESLWQCATAAGADVVVRSRRCSGEISTARSSIRSAINGH